MNHSDRRVHGSEFRDRDTATAHDSYSVAWMDKIVEERLAEIASAYQLKFHAAQTGKHPEYLTVAYA